MGKYGTTMILVYGTGSFVDWWSVHGGRNPPKTNGGNGSKIQGPLLNLFQDVGYDKSKMLKY